MSPKKNTVDHGIAARPCRFARRFGGADLWPILVLIPVTLVLYYNSLSNGFVFDDYAVIVENKHITDLGGSLPAFVSDDYFKIAGGEDSYRPLATLSYFLIHSFAGPNPFYFHLISVLLHLLNVILVFLLARLLLESRFGALSAGLLFACHPALTEAVDCIAFNEDLLAAFFFLLAFFVYAAKVTREFAAGWYGLSLLLYLCGLLSKEMAVTLPAIICLYDVTFKGDREQKSTVSCAAKTFAGRWRVYLGYAIISLVYLVLRFFVITKSGDGGHIFYGTFFERLIYLPNHIFSFIKLAAFPYELKVARVFAYPPYFFKPTNLIGFTTTIGLAVASFFLFRKYKSLFFGIWWFLISLLPVSNLIQIFNPFAERYLYIPLIGLCLAVAAALAVLFNRMIKIDKAIHIASSLVMVLIICLCSPITIARNRDWKDGLTLWSKAVKQSPDSGVARGSLGRAYQERGMQAEAIAEYEAAVRLMPNHFKAYYNLGIIYDQQNNFEQASTNYKASIRIHPGFADAHFNLANLYQKNGLTGMAVEHYQTVIELSPQDIEARNNLGVAYAVLGKMDRAIAAWQGVLKIDPANISAKENVAKARILLQNSN
jgi:tetratricopeptide (TPR) repeat protein